MRLERESLERQRGIINLNNIHYRGALPEAEAVKLMRETEPPPSWLSKGKDQEYPGLVSSDMKLEVDKKVAKGWPPLSSRNIESFDTLVADEIKGPARLYRILSPNSRAMSDCWVTEDVFKQLQAATHPRAAWRKHLAVWPDWNVNGQFVIYDIKPGESLKVWRGKASTQLKKSLPDRHLEGGWEQIVFNISRNDARNDTMLYYPCHGAESKKLQNALSTEQASNGLLPTGTTLYYDTSFPEGFSRYKIYVNIDRMPRELETLQDPTVIDPIDATAFSQGALLKLLRNHPLTKDDIRAIINSGYLSKDEIKEILSEFTSGK